MPDKPAKLGEQYRRPQTDKHVIVLSVVRGTATIRWDDGTIDTISAFGLRPPAWVKLTPKETP